MRPSLVVRPAFLAALARPRLRRIVLASSKLPFASVRAPLHSIIPAPVRSDEAFTRRASGLLGGARETALAEDRVGLFEVALRLGEGALALHHPRARLVAELLHHVCRDWCRHRKHSYRCGLLAIGFQH